MSAAGDLSAAAQRLPYIERWRCWSILEASPFTDSFPVCQASRKTVALHSTLLVLLGEKSDHWNSSPRHGALLEQKLCSSFCTEMIRPDRALTAQSATRLPELATSTRSCALWLICNDQIDWKLNGRRMRMRWNTAVIDRENVLARSERACRWFWNETWNF